MDLQNCLNFQRELFEPPAHSYPVANVTQRHRNATETFPTQRNLHAGKQKTKQKNPKEGGKGRNQICKINHTEKKIKIKTTINKT